MVDNLVKLFRILFTGQLKRRMAFLVLFSFFNSILQALGLFSTLPYLTLVMNPDLVKSASNYQRLYSLFGSPPINNFLLLFGIVVVLLIILSNAAFYYNVKFQMNLLVRLQVKLSDRLLSNYLQKDYTFFLTNNSNDLSKRILNDSFTVVDQVIFSVFNIITYGAMIAIIAGLLFFVNFYLTVVSVLVVGLFYGIFYTYTRRGIHSFSSKKFEFLKLRFKIINELFRAIKDVKVNSLETVFRTEYNKYEKVFFENHAKGSLLTSTPGLGMDVVVFGGIICATLVILFRGEGINSILPLLMMFALAVYKIKPYAQMLFKSINLIQVSAPSLAIVVDDLLITEPLLVEKGTQETNFLPGSIVLEKVSYRYPGSGADSLSDVSLEIKPNSTIAFVGQSGAGKTTLADIILGLLKPDSGRLVYANTEINRHNVEAWRAIVGYVPQQITLLDKSIAENVALGIDKHFIDEKRVLAALVTAGLLDFVQKQSEGIWTMVGDNGVRISGGQKQRIGIARALYKSPKVLLLDESTSALDGITEGEVMQSLLNISKEVTIILIAHRFTTIRECDTIILFNKGKLVDQGNYTTLMERNEEFRLLSKEMSN